MYHIQALDTFVSKRTNVPSEHCTLLIMTSRYDHLAPIIIPYEDTDTCTVGHHFLYKVAHFKVPWVDCLATQQGVILVIHTGNCTFPLWLIHTCTWHHQMSINNQSRDCHSQDTTGNEYLIFLQLFCQFHRYWSICLHFFHTVVLRKSAHFLTLHNIFIVKVVLRRSAHVNTIQNTSTSTVVLRKTALSLRTTFPLKCKSRDNDNRCI